MNTTQPITPSTPGSAGFGDQLAEILELTRTVFVAGPPLLVAGAANVLLALMLAGPFALLVTLVVALVAATALVALAVAILATPYLLVRRVRGHGVHRTTSDGQPQVVALESQRAVA
jgi:hypothetical protein